MAFTPRKNKFSFKVPVFDGGLNTKYTDLNTPVNQTPDCNNVVFDDFGAVGTSYGYTAIGSPIASAPIDGMYEHIANSGTRYLLAACDGRIWQYASSTWSTIVSEVSIGTAGQDVHFITVDDEVYITNGYFNPYRWDGTYFFRVGVSSPTAAVASAVCSASGLLNGTYQYALTGVNSANVEGDYATLLAAALAVTSGQVSLTDIPIFDASFGVDTKYLYRNTAGVSTTYYRVTALSANQTAYVDNAADSSLVTGAPSDNGVPPQVKFIVYHRNRAFGAGNSTYPMRLYWSTQGAPETWPAVNYTDIGKGDGQPIVGMAVYGNTLFIHKNDGRGHGTIYGVYMPDSIDVTDDSNWYIDKIAIAEGGSGHKSITFFNNFMLYCNKYGVYTMAGQELAKSPAYSAVGVFPTDAISFLIEPDVKEFKDSILNKIASITYDNKVWMSVPYGDSATANNRIYVYDYMRASGGESAVAGAWSKLDNPPVNCFSTYEGDLYGGSSNSDGKVYKLNTGWNQNSSAIDSYFYTVWLSGLPEHRDNTKVWRYCYIWVETSGDWNLNVQYWVDFDSGTGVTETVDLDSGGSKWDEAVWDVDVFGGGKNKQFAKIVLQNAVGKHIQFKFYTNTANQHFKVYDMELEYNLRGRRD